MRYILGMCDEEYEFLKSQLTTEVTLYNDCRTYFWEIIFISDSAYSTTGRSEVETLMKI